MGEVICCVKEHLFMRNLNMCLWQGGWEFWAQVAGFLQFDAPTPRHVKLAVGVVDGNSIGGLVTHHCKPGGGSGLPGLVTPGSDNHGSGGV